MRIHAHPDGASVSGLPEGWTIGEPAHGRGEPHGATVTSHLPRQAQHGDEVSDGVSAPSS